MDIRKMFNKRFGNEKGYEDGVIYTEVINDIVYKTHQNGVVRYKKRAEKGYKPSETEARGNLEWLVDKIPFKYYLMTLDFYKDVNEKHHTEACVLFYWNKDNLEIPADLLEQYGSGIIQDGQLIVIAPKQTNSGALSQYVEKVFEGNVVKTVLTPMVQWLEDNTVCILETHSHNTMSAFWSPTDDNNERHSRLRLYAVIGKVNAEEMVKARVHLLGDYFDLQIEDIFEMPKINLQADIDGEMKNVSDFLPNEISSQYYTGPFKYSETHPESWFDLFSVASVPKPKVQNSSELARKYNIPRNKHFSPFSYLDDEDTDLDDEELDENGEALADIDEDFSDENGNFDHNLYHGAESLFSNSRPKKSIMNMTDKEFIKFKKDGFI